MNNYCVERRGCVNMNKVKTAPIGCSSRSEVLINTSHSNHSVMSECERTYEWREPPLQLRSTTVIDTVLHICIYGEKNIKLMIPDQLMIPDRYKWK